ncbi:hypothetical protein CO731_03051 [Aminobacter sp. MSH1]|uniref:hypothetical protein n=1 Tax=Aminobacter sp. MSH1 TaxID=374606 RepID=UPI000D355933|nr:hypothetical protein [Aminobacter sp. MSH1]AWC23579.1 hypothetical protein CO731_03051 [Aminobacter sp. MSH1]
MLGLNKFDQMVKRPGDGLLPEMRELFERLATIRASANVTELANYRDQSRIQSGPNPAVAADRSAPNVVSLRSVQNKLQTQRKTR